MLYYVVIQLSIQLKTRKLLIKGYTKPTSSILKGKISPAIWHSTESSEGYYIIQSGQLLPGEGMTSTAPLILGKIISLVKQTNKQNKAEWNAMTMNKSFCKSIDGEF